MCTKMSVLTSSLVQSIINKLTEQVGVLVNASTHPIGAGMRDIRQHKMVLFCSLEVAIESSRAHPAVVLLKMLNTRFMSF